MERIQIAIIPPLKSEGAPRGEGPFASFDFLKLATVFREMEDEARCRNLVVRKEPPHGMPQTLHVHADVPGYLRGGEVLGSWARLLGSHGVATRPLPTNVVERVRPTDPLEPTRVHRPIRIEIAVALSDLRTFEPLSEREVALAALVGMMKGAAQSHGVVMRVRTEGDHTLHVFADVPNALVAGDVLEAWTQSCADGRATLRDWPDFDGSDPIDDEDEQQLEQADEASSRPGAAP